MDASACPAFRPGQQRRELYVQRVQVKDANDMLSVQQDEDATLIGRDSQTANRAWDGQGQLRYKVAR